LLAGKILDAGTWTLDAGKGKSGKSKPDDRCQMSATARAAEPKGTVRKK
jgi:hypothetical protein